MPPVASTPGIIEIAWAPALTEGAAPPYSPRRAPGEGKVLCRKAAPDPPPGGRRYLPLVGRDGGCPVSGPPPPALPDRPRLRRFFGRRLRKGSRNRPGVADLQRDPRGRGGQASGRIRVPGRPQAPRPLRDRG